MKSLYLLMLVGILCILQSCSLDEVNNRMPVADTYYVTEEGARKLVNSVYSYSQKLYEHQMWQFTENGTDLWMRGGDGETRINNYTLDASLGQVKDVWNSCYEGITAANTLLSRAENIEASEEVVSNYMGQAYFLRAFYYHVLVMQFGDLPLVLDEVTQVETVATRTTEADIYKQIIKDLLEAERLLPDMQNDNGRATRTAAQTLLARVYLWNAEYENAAEYALKVIAKTDQVGLLDDYADLWNPANQKNKEFIWCVQGSSNDTYNQARSWVNHLFCVRYDLHGADYGMVRDIANGRPYRHFMPTRHLINMMNERLAWDNRIRKSFKWVWYVNDESKTKKNPGAVVGDTALFVPPYKVTEAQRKWAEGKYRIEDVDEYFDPSSSNGEQTLGPREMFPQLTKYMDPTRATTGECSTLDIPVLRLGEAYLIAAEALLQCGKPEKGVEYVNALIKRATDSDADYDAHKIKASDLSIDVILDERAIELCAETAGRWPDLKRTGKLLDLVREYNVDARNNIQEKHLLRPIPEEMLDRVTNKDTFKQNPGY